MPLWQSDLGLVRWVELLHERSLSVSLLAPVSRGTAKPTVFEITSIWNALGYVADVAQGGLTGPTIKLYEIPADRR
jgi:hypothetical protein